MTIKSFEDLGLPAPLSAALTRMNYTTPTPIQAQAIPFALDGRDILGSAQTGTGKTAAFCIPMIAALMNDARLCGLVLAPTRELAMQVMDVAKQMIERGTGVRTALLIGGEPMYKQFKQLNDRPRLIIGTPGRVNDHLRRNPALFEDTGFVVLDEADRMLDMGFSVQIDTILEAARQQRQTLMFSATFAPKILKFARTYLQNPQRVEIESAKVSAENIAHEMITVTQDGKYDRLRAELEARTGSVIVFVKTKHGADKLAKRLQGDGNEATALHGGLNQRQRERTTKAFREMKFRVMVATDVAARGLDIPHVEHVINYDMPMVAEDYIHRIGRTARAGAKGHALAIVSPSDRGLWNDVERLLNPRKQDERDERSEGEGRKPFRKGPFKKGGFNKGGFGKGGFNKKPGGFRERDGEREGSTERKSYGDRDRSYKKQDGDRPFKKYDGERKSYGDRPQGRPDGERKSYGERKSFGDRPSFGDKPQGGKFAGKKPFKRREDGNNERDHARSFFEERPPYADRPRGEKSDFRQDRDRDGNRKFDRKDGDKPAGKRPFGGKSEGRFERSDKPQGKPYGKKFSGDKPQGRQDGERKSYGDRPSFGARPQGKKPYGGAAGKGGAKPGFKKRFAS